MIPRVPRAYQDRFGLKPQKNCTVCLFTIKEKHKRARTSFKNNPVYVRGPGFGVESTAMKSNWPNAVLCDTFALGAFECFLL